MGAGAADCSRVQHDVCRQGATTRTAKGNQNRTIRGRYSAHTVRHYCTLESDPMRPRACASHAPPYHVMCVVLSRAAEVVRPWYNFPVLWPKETLKYLSNKFRLWKSEFIAEIKSVLGSIMSSHIGCRESSVIQALQNVARSTSPLCQDYIIVVSSGLETSSSSSAPDMCTRHVHTCDMCTWRHV